MVGGAFTLYRSPYWNRGNGFWKLSYELVEVAGHHTQMDGGAYEFEWGRGSLGVLSLFHLPDGLLRFGESVFKNGA